MKSEPLVRPTTIADLFRKCEAELDSESPFKTNVTCYCCGRVFVSRKDPEYISDAEACDMDDCVDEDEFRDDDC